VTVCASGRFERRRLNAAEWLILGYAGLALLSTSWSLAPSLTFVRAAQLSIISAVALISVRVLRPAQALWTACKALAIYVVICSSSRAVFAATELTPIDPDERFRFSWFAVHPITAGTMAGAAAIALSCLMLFSPRTRAKRILGVRLPLFTTILIGVLLATSARGPLLAFVAAIATVLIMRTRWSLRFGAMSAAAAVLFLYLASGADYRDWVASAAQHDSAAVQMFFRGQSADRVLGLNGRLELWDDLSPAVASSTALGYGYQASRAVVLDTAPWAAFAHNALLQAVLDLGLVGTIGLIGLIAFGFVFALRSDLSPRVRVTVVALMTFLIVNSLGAESFAGSPGIETLLLLLCVLCATTRRETRAGAAAAEATTT
jgi:O-antigen ligase